MSQTRIIPARYTGLVTEKYGSGVAPIKVDAMEVRLPFPPSPGLVFFAPFLQPVWILAGVGASEAVESSCRARKKR